MMFTWGFITRLNLRNLIQLQRLTDLPPSSLISSWRPNLCRRSNWGRIGNGGRISAFTLPLHGWNWSPLCRYVAVHRLRGWDTMPGEGGPRENWGGHKTTVSIMTRRDYTARQWGTDQYYHLSHVNHQTGRAQTLPVMRSAHSRVPGTALCLLPIGPQHGTAHITVVKLICSCG